MMCPFCNIELQPSAAEYYCPNTEKNIGVHYHLYYNLFENVVTALNDEGYFTFTLNNDNEITCAIFCTDTSGEKVWLTQEDESRRDGCIIKYPNISKIPKIIEKFEIQRLFE